MTRVYEVTPQARKHWTWHCHSSFKANCTCRAVVDVLVIAPAVPVTPVGVKVISAGVWKFARFSRLKISARNCQQTRPQQDTNRCISAK